MLKRTLIAVAVVALLATSAAQALGPDPSTGRQGDHTGIKVDPQKLSVLWPFEYKYLDLCVIPVKMKVGLFVQIEKCYKLKIILNQVECGDIGKNSSGDWPCYKGCTNIKVRSNFDMKLGLNKTKVGPILDKWEAFYTGGNTVTGGSGWNTLEICVEAWKARLYEQTTLGDAGAETEVGTVTVTVKPNV